MADNKKNSGLLLIDPNDVTTTLPEGFNGTPEYEKMFIFAELTAERRSRTVIVNRDGKTRGVETLTNINIGMMGSDQSDPNNVVYSTKWTENITGTETPYEGFGIKNIKVVTNSSYIPQVKIEFIDIRGLVFFNLGKKSPYSILFDFPPPIFNLTLKGYYGKSLTYQLHLVRTNTKFESDSGNFIITIDFIARTFAPLTDIPFKYVDLLPLAITSVGPNIQEIDIEGKPENTHQLLARLRKLYHDIEIIKNTSEESKAIADAQLALNKAKTLISNIGSFGSFLNERLQEKTKTIIYDSTNNIPDNVNNIREIKNLNEYNEVLLTIKSNVVKNDFKHRLFLAIKTSNDSFEEDLEIINELNNKLKINKLIPVAKNLFDVSESDITSASRIISSLSTEKQITYIGIDITVYYIKLQRFINEKNRELFNENTIRTDKFNEVVVRDLGGLKPTIYNIFKILCDDIDRLFNVLRITSINAINHHEQNLSLIIDAVKETRVGAFPLYIKEQINNCNVKTQTRAIPIDLSQRVEKAGGGQFPEITLVDNFINAFINQEKENLINELITQTDGDGNNKWIPISPTDSNLTLNNYESPYRNLKNQYQNINNDTLLEKIYNKIIERFYVASQHTYGRDFFLNNSSVFPEDNKLVKMIATAEATNLANSLIKSDIIDNLIEVSKKYNTKNNVNKFFTDIKNIYAFNNVNDKFLKLGNDTNIGENNTLKALYNDPLEDGYIGIEIRSDTVELRSKTAGGDSDNLIDKFLENDTNIWNEVLNFFNFGEINIIKQFSQQNIIYIADADPENDYKTTYLTELQPAKFPLTTITQKIGKIEKDRLSKSFIGVWSEYLENRNKELLSFLKESIQITTNSTEQDKKDAEGLFDAQAFWIAANFGGTRSFFSNHGSKNPITSINGKFKIPSILEVPFFSVIYMGGLVKYNSPDDYAFKLKVNEIYDTLSLDLPDLPESKKMVKETLTGGSEYIGDVEAIKKLSKRDQFEFLRIFNIFSNENRSGSRGFLETKNSLIELLEKNINVGKKNYIKLLEDPLYKQNIVEHLNKKYNIINFNQFTFDLNYSPTSYKTLVELNTDSVKLNINETYFLEFFRKLIILLKDRKKRLDTIEINITKSIDDFDIKTQMYYSFKNITDKWISGLGNRLIGFPLNNDEDDHLINKFAFVDRAMNPIGDRMIINVDTLLDVSLDYDTSAFTVFSRLLSLNGLEFFPLQNLMSFKNSEWEDSFKISNNFDQDNQPAFVCMYIGGTSTILNNPNSYFDDDGIIDLEGEGLTDFHSNDCDEQSKPQEVTDSPTTPYSEVRAFKVRFAEQDQSMFTNIELDSREYPETNESLAILSKLANDEGKSAPTPKGQNLFSMYEVRSYSSKVTTLGNMMIQPTQYFQLENIPMFSGAYIILEVEHNIVPNHMLTTFSGVRILKYPNPLVTEFLTSVGVQASSLGISPYSNETLNQSINRIKDGPIYAEAQRSGILSALASPKLVNTGDEDSDKFIKKLHPLTIPKAIQLIKNFNEDENYKSLGITLVVTSGLRTYEEQNMLYNKGRTVFNKEGIVTYATAGKSFHNYGLAFDVVPLDKDKNKLFGTTDETEIIRWKKIGELGKALKLSWGGDFTDNKKDYPHFEDKYGEPVGTYLSMLNNGDVAEGYPIINITGETT